MKYICSLLLLASSMLPVNAETLMYIRDDVLDNYYKFLNGRNVHSITNFKSQFVRRDVVDMIIVQQALKLGGFNANFQYAAGRLNFRNTKLLEQGRLLLSFDTYWLADAIAMQEHVYISKPVIRKGEYHAGIYASPIHPTIFEIKNKHQLKDYTSVSTPRWKTDWKTLQALSLKELVREDEWVSQANMVSNRLIDFMMMPFNSDGKDTYQLEKIVLKHVPNTALLLNDSRHFVISKSHPLGQKAHRAINKGLGVLRSQKRIETAYRQAGFLIDTSKFNILNK